MCLMDPIFSWFLVKSPRLGIIKTRKRAFDLKVMLCSYMS